MKKGMVIIFDKNDIHVSENRPFKSFFNKSFKICLVNNGNHVKLLKFLYKLKETSKCEVSILNLRKEKASDLALKAGVRFLFNNDNINLIVHAKPKNIFDKKLMKKIVNISDEDLRNKIDERVLLRKVYALNEIVNC
ncbi:hypothetical protein [Polaribacter sp. Hel1_85]|uniref:hypothetical protein n=1 Tax=Polaribacter sp. Hel1_85 TaxID=1250005 RepID=UPI00056B7488|nr:hypothetical protein [Polaribacter sp. Hel1_85]